MTKIGKIEFRAEGVRNTLVVVKHNMRAIWVGPGEELIPFQSQTVSRNDFVFLYITLDTTLRLRKNLSSSIQVN